MKKGKKPWNETGKRKKMAEIRNQINKVAEEKPSR